LKFQKINRVKGTKDILPTATALWQEVEEVAREVFELYNFHEIRLPVFEKTEVFTKSIGETSDIVEKEMYTFTDRGGESLTLRPEGTASVVRAFVENSLYNKPGVKKLYYMGPMFRAERPQAGRFRQFHQIGAEVFGTDEPSADAELILALLDFFEALNITGLELKLNSLGCPVCRPAYRDELASFLKSRIDSLCESCQRRVDKNPFRALDCKSKGCKEVVSDAPSIDSFLCGDCKDHFQTVKELLGDAGVSVTLDPKLVRGLDYYSRTAFEVTSSRLGSQDAVAGGGRYNSLVEQFGGPPTPAIGFALGMERLLTLIDAPESEPAPDLFLVAVGGKAEKEIFLLARRLRQDGFMVERGFGGGNLNNRMKKADKSGARFAVIIGDDEIANASATIKDLVKGTQKQVGLDEISKALEDALLASIEEESE